jgi:hypothetical protein
MLWRVAHGETTGLRHAIERLAEAARTPNRDAVASTQQAWTCEVTLAARLEATVDGPGAGVAQARLDSVSRTGSEGSQEVLNAMNLTAARLLSERGDLAGARAALRRFFHYRGTDLSTRSVEEGRLAERSGDREAAIRAYQHYLALRRNPEPSVLPEVQRIKATLARLVGEPPA